VNSGLERTSHIIGIEVQTGTRNVALEGDYVTGAWDAEGTIYRIGKRRAISLDMLNPFLGKNRLADAVVDFTNRFGPLTIPFCCAASFRFSISEWKMARRNLHWVWKAASSGLKRNRSFTLPVDKSDGDHFRLDKGRITFRTQRLSTYMALEIATIPAERLRMCANFVSGCKSPFFFASDLREKYCSETCAHASKRRAKLEWWNENRRGK
jgi:hypothetical protein